MVQKARNFLALRRLRFLWGFVIIFHLMTATNNAFAAKEPLTLTIEAVKNAAQDYLDNNDSELFFNQIRELSSGEVDPAMKAMLIGLKDEKGRTLFEKMTTDSPDDNIADLLKIAGLEVASIRGATLEGILSVLGTFEDLFRYSDPAFYEKSLTHLLAQVTPEQEKELKGTVTVAMKERDGGKREYEIDNRDLTRIIAFSPHLFADQKLELLGNFFEAFILTPKGREVLREYKLADGRNLLKYYEERLHDAGLDQHRNTARYRNTARLCDLIKAYSYDHITITPAVLDIDGSDFPLDDLFTLARGSDDRSLKQFLASYRNSKGETFTHFVLAETAFEPEGVESMIQSLREAIDNDVEFHSLLIETKGVIERTSWGAGLLKETDPHLLVQPKGPYGVTPLMKRAFLDGEFPVFAYMNSLERLGFSVDAQDLFGNTARSIGELRERKGFKALLLRQSLSGYPFQDTLWGEIVNFPYRREPLSIWEFFREALDVVKHQPQTVLHRAFLQEDVSSDCSEANALWASLFRAYDDLKDKELTDERQEYEKNGYDMGHINREKEKALIERELPLAVRYLKSLSLMGYDDMQTDMAVRVLSGNSTFGMDFTLGVNSVVDSMFVETIDEIASHVYMRFMDKMSMQESQEDQEKAVQEVQESPEAQKAFMSSIVIYINKTLEMDLTIDTVKARRGEVEKKLGEKFSDSEFDDEQLANEKLVKPVFTLAFARGKVTDAFFKRASEESNLELLDRQLDCAVIALSCFVRKLEENMFDLRNVDDLFALIDWQLEDRVPAGEVVNSKRRIERIKRLLPADFEFDFMPPAAFYGVKAVEAGDDAKDY